jgi:hypothetical protein
VANAGTITTLNNLGSITGGVGGHAYGQSYAGTGGAGISNAATITKLANSGSITGGVGGVGASEGGQGGAGVANSGAIGELVNTGGISGGTGGTGYDVGRLGGDGISNSKTIGTLVNHGQIAGGTGGFGGFGLTGGVGIWNEQGATIGSLNNAASAAIRGGGGGGGVTGGGGGGAALINAGTITTLTNQGVISGGSGSFNSYGGGRGATGVQNTGAISTLTNGGAISGGSAAGFGGGAGAGVSNGLGPTIGQLINKATGAISGGNADYSAGGAAGVSNAGMITTLTNSGRIAGGAGGAAYNSNVPGGAGGAGVANFGTIGSLVNRGFIGGGAGGAGVGYYMSAGAGGAGVSNSGTIRSLVNRGTITGGPGGGGSLPGPVGDAIYSAGANAKIGSIANSGQIIGNVEIDNQPNVTVTGGTGKTFGVWTGGTITIGAGNLTFAGGNTALGDKVVVDGGAGTVFNNDPLRVTAPITINGDFDQGSTGALTFLVSGNALGQYGTLAVTGTTSLDGGIGLDLASQFRLAAGDSFFVLMSGGALSGEFGSVSVDGAACSGGSGGAWLCRNVGYYLDLDVMDGVNGSVEFSVAGVPEPSTWALLGLGFLGVGGLALRRRKASVLA